MPLLTSHTTQTACWIFFCYKPPTPKQFTRHTNTLFITTITKTLTRYYTIAFKYLTTIVALRSYIIFSFHFTFRHSWVLLINDYLSLSYLRFLLSNRRHICLRLCGTLYKSTFAWRFRTTTECVSYICYILLKILTC